MNSAPCPPGSARAQATARPLARGDQWPAGRSLLGGLGLVLLLAGVGIRIVPRPRPGSAPGPAAPPEMDRSNLVLRLGRWVTPPGDTPFCGVMTDHYPDGHLMSRSAVSNGVLHGPSQGWYSDGTLQITEHFVSGVSHGLRTKWYPSGARQSEVAVCQGRLQGTFHRWHENGRLAESISLSNGEPEGVSWAFYPSGRTQARARHAGGVLVENQSWKDGERTAPAPETLP